MPEPVLAPLSTAERLALRRLAAERDISIEEAAALAIREFLIAGGLLEWEDDAEDQAANRTTGSYGS